MANIKLSVAQQKVMDQAHSDIYKARECATAEEWFTKYKAFRYGNCTPEEFKTNNPEYWAEVIVKSYNRGCNGIVLTHCSSKTIAKLEKLGLIEIIHNSCGTNYGIDVVKVLDI